MSIIGSCPNIKNVVNRGLDYGIEFEGVTVLRAKFRTERYIKPNEVMYCIRELKD